MSADEEETRIINEKLKPFEKWRDKFKEDWNYKKKLVVFEDANGNRVTPTTTTTTTTTSKPNITSPRQNTTKYTHPTEFTPVVVITTTDPHTGEVSSADTTELIKIVGITCASLIGLILLILCVIRLCRISTSKRKERVTVRRPLTEPEREDHIYAEIEPLQAMRSASPGGASGSSGDVQLPRKKHKKRRGGVSSFRALSTRIYRFFNVETDNQSVFYNRTTQEATVEPVPPEPPERNTANGKKTKRVNRFESTASRRPLLDGDSRTDISRDSTSSAAELRGNIYNPLLKQAEGRAPSGPYDHLTLSKTQSGNIRDSDATPPSPHDYFTLEKSLREGTLEENSDQKDSGYLTESNSATRDSVVIENELHGGISTIEEESEVSETPKNHEYFILEPHQRSVKNPEEKSSEKSAESPSKSRDSSRTVSPVKETKSKPEVTPRVTKNSEGKSPSESKPLLPSNESSSPYEVAVDIGEAEEIKGSESKEETYVLSKLGDAPKPPEAVNDDEYLSPLQVDKKPEYVDVFPNPPPRSSSLQSHEVTSTEAKKEQKSPVHSKASPKHESELPAHKHESELPAHKAGSVSPKHKASQKHSNKSPTHKAAPTHSHKPVSPTRSKVETDI